MNKTAIALIKHFDANQMDEVYFAAVKGDVKTVYYKRMLDILLHSLAQE